MWSDERRSCPTRLSARNTHLLHSVSFGDYPILFRSGGGTAGSSRLWSTIGALGDPDLLYVLLGACGSDRYHRAFQSRRNLGKHRCDSLASWHREHRRNAPHLSTHSALQPNRLSPPPMELGAYLHLPSLRKLSADHLLTCQARSVSTNSLDRVDRFRYGPRFSSWKGIFAQMPHWGIGKDLFSICKVGD